MAIYIGVLGNSAAEYRLSGRLARLAVRTVVWSWQSVRLECGAQP